MVGPGEKHPALGQLESSAAVSAGVGRIVGRLGVRIGLGCFRPGDFRANVARRDSRILLTRQSKHICCFRLRMAGQPVDGIALGRKPQPDDVDHLQPATQWPQRRQYGIGVVPARRIVIGPDQHITAGQRLPVRFACRIRRARRRHEQPERGQLVRLVFAFGEDHHVIGAGRQFVQPVQRLAIGRPPGLAQLVPCTGELHRPNPLLAGCRMLGTDAPIKRVRLSVGVGVQRLELEAAAQGAAGQPARRVHRRFLGDGHGASSHAPSDFAASTNRSSCRRMWNASTSPPRAPHAMQRNAPVSIRTRNDGLVS